MKYDEFAFFNQQLAAMLRENIPLEGALRQLCQNLGRGKLRSEIELLETDLSKGTPLKPRSRHGDFRNSTCKWWRPASPATICRACW